MIINSLIAKMTFYAINRIDDSDYAIKKIVKPSFEG